MGVILKKDYHLYKSYESEFLMNRTGEMFSRLSYQILVLNLSQTLASDIDEKYIIILTTKQTLSSTLFIYNTLDEVIIYLIHIGHIDLRPNLPMPCQFNLFIIIPMTRNSVKGLHSQNVE